MISTRKVFIITLVLLFFFLNQKAFALFSPTCNGDIKKKHSWTFFNKYPNRILKTKIPPKKFVYNLPITDTVYISGNVNLTILGNQPADKMIIRNTYDGRNTDIKFYEGSLYIGNNSQRSMYAPIRKTDVVLYVSSLRKIFVSGNNTVYARNIAHYCGLELTTCGSGSICLEGPTHLKRIVNTGNTIITAHQVMTDHLHILNTCAGKINLSGCADLLLIRAFGSTTTDAKCVRAHTAFIQTGHNAFVLVRADRNLRAFAAGSSNVYYFTTPFDIVKHNSGSANILQFANW